MVGEPLSMGAKSKGYVHEKTSESNRIAPEFSAEEQEGLQQSTGAGDGQQGARVQAKLSESNREELIGAVSTDGVGQKAPGIKGSNSFMSGERSRVKESESNSVPVDEFSRGFGAG